MFKPGSLKFCFCVSLVFHTVMFGMVKWLGNDYRPPSVEHQGDVITLNLVAAPIEAATASAVSVVQSPVAALPAPVPAPVIPPAPVVEPPPPPVEKTIAETPVAVEPARDPDPPKPETAPAEVKPNLEAIASATVPPATVARGDGSSAQPGNDATTSEARPGVLAHPNYLKNPEPAYPLQARRRRQEGTVLLEVKVTTRGRAAEVSVKESSGYPALDEAALAAVREWEFEAARMGPVAVESRIEVPVRFRLLQ